MTLSESVDQLGILKAQIAELSKEKKTIENDLKSSGITAASGTLYDLTISTYVRTTIAWKKICSLYSIPKRTITSNTSYSDVTKITLTSRKQKVA